MGRERGGQEMTERTLLNVVSKCPFSFFSFFFFLLAPIMLRACLIAAHLILLARHDCTLFALSHSLSLSSALPRWLILFFSLLSISAYVWPLYSKHESQPMHAC